MQAPSPAVPSAPSLVDLDGTAFVQLALFVVALAILERWVFRPLLATFSAREVATAGVADRSRELERQALDARATYENELSARRRDIRREAEGLQMEAEVQARELLARTKANIDRQMASAEASLARDRARLQQQVGEVAKPLGKLLADRLGCAEVDSGVSSPGPSASPQAARAAKIS